MMEIDNNNSHKKAIVVVGSVNMDLMVRCPHLPAAGETVMGHSFSQAPGGKGANQAVAAARLGAHVSLIACVGDDDHGRMSMAGFAAAGINTAQVHIAGGVATGIAMITSDAQGENCIAIASGANDSLTREHLDQAASLIADAAMLVCQFESPLPVVLHAINLARQHGVPVLLNPAPMLPISLGLLAGTDIVVLNAIEASMLSTLPVGTIHQVCQVAEFLRSAGLHTVIVTLGKDGVVLADESGTHHHVAPQVVALDSTGAGDTFVGALACALVSGTAMLDAIQFAQQAAALSVTRRGAQASMPSRAEIKDFFIFQRANQNSLKWRDNA
jgi:ribokinase